MGQFSRKARSQCGLEATDQPVRPAPQKLDEALIRFGRFPLRPRNAWQIILRAAKSRSLSFVSSDQAQSIAVAVNSRGVQVQSSRNETPDQSIFRNSQHNATFKHAEFNR
jgi:hypothetical protein